MLSVFPIDCSGQNVDTQFVGAKWQGSKPISSKVGRLVLLPFYRRCECEKFRKMTMIISKITGFVL